MVVLKEPKLKTKLANLELAVQNALLGKGEEIPEVVARDTCVVAMRDLPEKPGLSLKAGKSRLLHDLASIELQAMELGLRTLIEFPNLVSDFREEMAALVLDEKRHLEMCLNALGDLGAEWGEWPVHVSLWSATSSEDSIQDRLLIVHRYLEGGGLDASKSILRKLNGLDFNGMKEVVETILTEEVGHVSFGSKWYKQFCERDRLDPDHDFAERLAKLFPRLPRRMERIDRELRRKAGFSEREMDVLAEFQLRKKH